MSAAAILIIRKGNPLAVYASRGWGLPAGKSEPSETSAQTAVRELEEETGLKVKLSDLKLLYSGPVPDREGNVDTFWAPDPGGDLRSSEEGVPAWVAWDTLLAGPYAEYNEKVRQAAIDQIPEIWVDVFGSGTLRRSLEQNMFSQNMYLAERTAMEFGFEFQLVPKSRLIFGIPIAEGDNPGITETCWHARTLSYRAQRDNLKRDYQVKWARIEEDGEIREGLAIICLCQDLPHWVPKGREIIAFTTEDGKPINPC